MTEATTSAATTPMNASGARHSSDASTSNPVVWTKGMPPRIAPETVAANTHMKYGPDDETVPDARHDGDVAIGETRMATPHDASVESSRQPSPSVAVSSGKRPSMHYRPVDVQDVLDAFQEDDIYVEKNPAANSSSCPYVVPGLYREASRRTETEEQDEEGSEEARMPAAEAAQSEPERRGVPVGLDDSREERGESVLAVVSDTDTGVPVGPKKEATPETPSSDLCVEYEELAETLVLKELVARDAVEAMAQAELDTALLIALQTHAQLYARATQAAGNDAPSGTTSDDKHVNEVQPDGKDADSADGPAVANAHDIRAPHTLDAPHTPHTPHSTRSSRSLPRVDTAGAGSQRPAADATEAAQPADVAVAGLAADDVRDRPSTIRKVASEPATSAQVTPAKRSSSALPGINASSTFLPALKRDPGARIVPYNALLESLNRSRLVPTRPHGPQTVLPSSRSRAPLAAISACGGDTQATPYLPQIGPSQSRPHLIDQREFYQRAGHCDYKSLFTQQKQMKPLIQRVAPLSNEVGS